jgi:uncharacterized protein YqjF (DUF2071 family)
MALMEAPPTPSALARARFLAEDPRPAACCAWSKVIFLHLAIDPAHLQPLIPFALDLWGREAYLSVVLFTQDQFRPSLGGRFGGWLARPIATYRFCNLRTYVRHDGEAGVLFLAEWITSLPSVVLARTLYGLPCRPARETYEHGTVNGTFFGSVQAGSGRLACHARFDYAAPVAPSPPNSLDEFCLERYSAFTFQRGRARRFHIWHAPWSRQRVEVQIEEASLLDEGDWYRYARPALAHYSPGVEPVWLGAPHRSQTDAALPGNL